MARPLVLLETFLGEEEWSQWISHYKSIAAVNEWDNDKKLLWLKARHNSLYNTFQKQCKEITQGKLKRGKLKR